jgi:hypothetical protein
MFETGTDLQPALTLRSLGGDVCCDAVRQRPRIVFHIAIVASIEVLGNPGSRSATATAGDTGRSSDTRQASAAPRPPNSTLTHDRPPTPTFAERTFHQHAP